MMNLGLRMLDQNDKTLDWTWLNNRILFACCEASNKLKDLQLSDGRKFVPFDSIDHSCNCCSIQSHLMSWSSSKFPKKLLFRQSKWETIATSWLMLYCSQQTGKLPTRKNTIWEYPFNHWGYPQKNNANSNFEICPILLLLQNQLQTVEGFKNRLESRHSPFLQPFSGKFHKIRMWCAQTQKVQLFIYGPTDVKQP